MYSNKRETPRVAWAGVFGARRIRGLAELRLAVVSALVLSVAASVACSSSASSGEGTGGSSGASAGGANAGGGAAGSAGARPSDGISQAGPATTGIVERACTAGATLAAVSEGDPARPNRTTGTNGVFVDECDASGTLTEYVCDSPFVCDGGCAFTESGQVTSRMTNCGIGRKNGACLSD